MKKIYQAPNTDIVFVATQPMMAMSAPEKGFNPDDATETEEISGNLSRRRRNQWEDEEEEDEYDF